MIHNDLGIPPVQEAIHDRSSKHRPNYNPIWIPYYDPYHKKMSYGDYSDGGQLTCNMVQEISSLEGTHHVRQSKG
jgi:hypothetical protein